MVKLFKKLCLCGILLTSINYELVYSTQDTILRAIAKKPQLPLPDLTQFNPQLVFNNEQVIDTTQLVLDSNKILSGTNILGKYDTSKFYVEDNTLYPVLCELDPNAGDYEVFTDSSGNSLALPYTGKITYENSEYIVFPISFRNINSSIYYEINSSMLYMVDSSESSSAIYIDNSSILPSFTNNISINDDVNSSGINIICINTTQTISDSKYKLSENNSKIIFYNPLAKFDSITQKWYETDESGEYKIKEGTEDEKIELNKAILSIPSNKTLTLKENEEPTSLEVTEFGKLINNGTIEAQNNTSIYGQKAIITTHELECYLYVIGKINTAGNLSKFLQTLPEKLIGQLYFISAFGKTFEIILNDNKKIIIVNREKFDTPADEQITSDGIKIKFDSENNNFTITKNGESKSEITNKFIQSIIFEINGQTIMLSFLENGHLFGIGENAKCIVTEGEESKHLVTVTDFEDNELYTATIEEESLFMKILDISDEWHYGIIQNLEDVAIQNDSGTIVFKNGSSISTKNNDGFPVIKDGTVDISDLIEFKNNKLVLKGDDTINSGFYNVNLQLFPDNFSDSPDFNQILTYFSNNDNFTDFNPLFTNIRFYSAEPSTIPLLIASSPIIIQQNINNVNKKTYNTNKSVVKADSSKSFVLYNTENIINNVLKLFYTEEDINKFGENPPLSVECTEQVKSSNLYDFLNNIQLYNDEYSANTQYGLDLFSFNFDKKTIDYSKLTDKIPTNIQFVVNKNYKGNKNLLLKSSNDELTIRQEFGNYPGILSLSPNIKRLNIINNSKNNTYSYTIKMNDNVKVKTKGNIKLLLDNNGELNSNGIKNIGGNLSINKYKTSNKLTIKLPASNFSSFANTYTQFNNIPIILK